MKDVLIHSLPLANNLMSQGYKMIHIEKNKKFDQKLVFFFKNENGIEQAIKQVLVSVKESTQLINYTKTILRE